MTKQNDILSALFGSANRVKLMKFFLLNSDVGFSVDDISTRLRMKPNVIRSEMNDLVKSGFVKSKVVVTVIPGKRKTLRKKSNGYIANQDFVLREPLRELLIDSGSVQVADLPKRFARAGKIMLLVVSGFFLHDNDRSMDLMIVGDRLDRKVVENEIKKIEADIGKELSYAMFDLDEFMYRLKMYDKLIRDVFDFPHEKIINKIDHPELRG